MPEGVTERPSILVVDDNPLILNVVKSLLASENYQVFTCVDGDEAINLLDKKSIDVIVCDVMMPRMDGYELQSAVRKRSEFAHIPFVFLTALSEDTEKLRGLESGADDYLVKPFEPQDLISVVRGKVMRSHYLRNIAEQKYESYRKKVIHTLSHEFRTPLVAINTGTELLIDQQQNLDEKKVTNLLEAIRRGGQRLEKLVNDFMLLQQIEAGIAQRMFDSKATSRKIVEVIESILDTHVESFLQDKVTANLKDNSNNAVVHIYEPHIQDIINRFISNAVKFSVDKKEIEVVIYRQSKEVVVDVRDRGVGFDMAKVKEAIDVFGQIDRERFEQQGGGLGLAIANRYAVINKGRIEFEKRPGGGSIVSLILPLAEPSKVQ